MIPGTTGTRAAARRKPRASGDDPAALGDAYDTVK